MSVRSLVGMVALVAMALFGAASADPLKILVVSDNHAASPGHRQVVARMLEERSLSSLLLNCGDLTSTGGSAEYDSFFAIEGALCQHLFYPTMGNHDAENYANWLKYVGPERWYSVHIGDTLAVHFLDYTQPHQPGSTQHDWLLAELLADSADGVRHIFICSHAPFYTSAEGSADDTLGRRYLSPLFERFGVEMVFGGHVHAYEHDLVNGVHYITTGCGGASPYPADSTCWHPQSWTVYYEGGMWGFVQVEIDGDRISSVGIRVDGSRFDSALITSDRGSAVNQPHESEVWYRLGAGKTYDAMGRAVYGRLRRGVYFRRTGKEVRR